MGRLVPKEKVINLCNIQCTDCSFAARFVMLGENDPLILSINSAELEPMLAFKTTLPPFIFYRSWKYADINMPFENAVFFPFVPYTLLKKPSPTISLTGQQDEDILLYVLDHELPHDLIYTSPSDEEIAEIVSNWQKLTASRIQEKFRTGYARSARIKDEANNIRRRKGLPIDEAQYEDEGEEDEEL